MSFLCRPVLKLLEGKVFFLKGMQQFLNSRQYAVWLKQVLNSKYWFPAYYMKTGIYNQPDISKRLKLVFLEVWKWEPFWDTL